MFEQSHYDEIEKCGLIGIVLEHVGARLNLTREDFLKLYSEDKIARIHYERGQSAGAEAALFSIKEKSKKDWKAEEYLATNIFNLKLDPKKKPIEVKSEESKDSWFDENIDID